MNAMENVKKTSGFAGISREIQTELLRKSIHMLIGLVPLMARFNVGITLVLLGAGVLVYAYAEWCRFKGLTIPYITEITQRASRGRDKNRIVLGPLTLAVGAMLCLLLYPSPAAAVGIYALAFGDGLSSLVGKIFGKIKIPFTGGKTVEGSMAAFFAIFVTAWVYSGHLGLSFGVAATGMLLEALPLDDLDNMVIPLGTSLAYAIGSYILT